MSPKKQPRKSASCSASLTVPELEQSKTTVLNMLASAHSRRWHPARQKRCRSDRTAARMWSATLENRELTTGSAAIEGKPLGDRRYGWEGRTTANGPRAGVV